MFESRGYLIAKNHFRVVVIIDSMDFITMSTTEIFVIKVSANVSNILLEVSLKFHNVQ